MKLLLVQVLSIVSSTAAAAPKVGWGVVNDTSGLRVLPAFTNPAAVAGQAHKADCSLYPTPSAAGCVANALPAAKSTDRPDVSLTGQLTGMCSDLRAAAGVKNCASHAIPLTFVEGPSANSARNPVDYDARSSNLVSLGLASTASGDIESIYFMEAVAGDLDEDGTVVTLYMSSLVTACACCALCCADC